MPNITKLLLEQRGPLVKQMQDMVKLAAEEKRSFTTEEREKFDRLDKEQADLKQRADDAHKVETLEGIDLGDPTKPKQSPAGDDGANLVDMSRGLRSWLMTPTGRVTPDEMAYSERCGFNPSAKLITMRFDRRSQPSPTSLVEAQDRLQRALDASPEERAQSVGTTTAGGFTVPDEMMRAIDVAMLQFSPMRATSTVIPTSTGADLPIPTTNDTANKGEIIAENTAANEQDVTFGQLVLQAYKYSSKMVRVSIELLQDNSVNVPVLLGRLLGERVGRIQADHFAVGTGTAQPNGIVTAAATSGVTSASNSALTFSEILQLKHAVDPAYRGPGSGFMGNDTTLRIMKEIADSQGRPIWMPNLTDGEPDRFDGSPFFVNQSMASGSSAKALLYGQLDKYLIRDVLEWNVLRLDERYAELAQIAFLGWTRNDGDLLDAGTSPVKYLTMAV